MQLYQVIFKNSRPILACPIELPDHRIIIFKRSGRKYAIKSLTIIAGNEWESMGIAHKAVNDHFDFLFGPPIDQNVLEQQAYSLN